MGSACRIVFSMGSACRIVFSMDSACRVVFPWAVLVELCFHGQCL